MATGATVLKRVKEEERRLKQRDADAGVFPQFPFRRKPDSCGTAFIVVPLHLVYCD